MTEWRDGIAKIVLPTPFPVGDVNVYVVKGERLTLIDVGPNTDEALQVLQEQLSTLGIKLSDIEQVILTHDHPDHAGLLDQFSPELDVYGHAHNERWLNRTETFYHEYESFYKEMFSECGVPDKYYGPFIAGMKNMLLFSCHRSLTGLLSEGQVPLGLSEWTAIETPGHAQSQIGLFRKKDGVFIGGDLLLAHISANPLLEPPLPGETDRPKPQLQVNDSLRKLLTFPIRLLYAGHGEEVTDVAGLVEKRLTHQVERAEQVYQWLIYESMTLFDICQRLFPTVYKRQLGLTLSESIAQIDYLLDVKKIQATKVDGTYVYRAIT
jgi:glyoxylase-like metal-dependent hydrolase (beta-lactamase superfamily II)